MATTNIENQLRPTRVPSISPPYLGPHSITWTVQQEDRERFVKFGMLVADPVSTIPRRSKYKNI